MATIECQRCGQTFEAKRSDARFCLPCRQERTREYANRPRPERYQQPGIGKGHYNRDHWQFVCSDCGKHFQSHKAGVQRCTTCSRERERQQERVRNSRREPCPQCGAPKAPTSARCRKCASLLRNGSGPASPTWKGGRSTNAAGYVVIRDGKRNRYEHVKVWEDANGPIQPGHHVHHVNEDKSDNRLSNLILLSAGDHKRIHAALARYQRSIARERAKLNERLASAGLPII